MKYLLILMTIRNTFAWGTPDLAKEEVRQKVYKIEHTLDKKKAFTKVVIWSVKTFVNSNETVKLKDPELGVFIAKGNLSCDALGLGSGFGKDQRIDFTLEITIEDKKAEIKATDIVGKSEGSYDSGARPSSPEEVEKVATSCLNPLVEKIKSELK